MNAKTKKIIIAVILLVLICVTRWFIEIQFNSLLDISLLFVFPIVIALTVLYVHKQSVSFGGCLIIGCVSIFLAEVVANTRYYLKTGISIFNDTATGSIGLGILILSIIIFLFIILFFKPKKQHQSQL